jgi:hypothetical protein
MAGASGRMKDEGGRMTPRSGLKALPQRNGYQDPNQTLWPAKDSAKGGNSYIVRNTSPQQEALPKTTLGEFLRGLVLAVILLLVSSR